MKNRMKIRKYQNYNLCTAQKNLKSNTWCLHALGLRWIGQHIFHFNTCPLALIQGFDQDWPLSRKRIHFLPQFFYCWFHPIIHENQGTEQQNVSHFGCNWCVCSLWTEITNTRDNFLSIFMKTFIDLNWKQFMILLSHGNRFGLYLNSMWP